MNASHWPLLLAAVSLLAAGSYWAIWEYVLPARHLQKALRQLAAGDWEAPVQIVRRGALRQAVEDAITLGDRLRETHRQLGDESFNLQTILGGLAEGVLIVDTSRKIRLANESLRRMFDLAAPPHGRALMEVFRDHDLQATVRAALDDEMPQRRELALDVRQGSAYVRKHFAVTVTALRAPEAGGPRGAIAIFHDISELKALEAVRRDFVANVSHELRTPVSIISGYLETLLDGALDDRPEAERFLRVMWKHNQRLTLLIEDLLSLSQIESRQAAGMQFESVDLRACLERVIERLEPTMTAKRAVVRLDLPTSIPVIEGDASRLDQVFFNLIENALKYGQSDHPEITARAEHTSVEVAVTVADNGPGIPAADLPHVFERFYRVRKDRSRAVGGTGLGLSIVKHVMLAHGGQVTVESQPGRGTAFRLTLPIMQNTEQENFVFLTRPKTGVIREPPDA